MPGLISQEPCAQWNRTCFPTLGGFVGRRLVPEAAEWSANETLILTFLHIFLFDTLFFCYTTNENFIYVKVNGSSETTNFATDTTKKS